MSTDVTARIKRMGMKRVPLVLVPILAVVLAGCSGIGAEKLETAPPELENVANPDMDPIVVWSEDGQSWLFLTLVEWLNLEQGADPVDRHNPQHDDDQECSQSAPARRSPVESVEARQPGTLIPAPVVLVGAVVL